jgi:long-chain fatty acid transport protein
LEIGSWAAGVVQDHVTRGATWSRPGGGEFSGYFAHAPGRTVRGRGSIPPGNPPAGFGGGKANVRLQETIVSVAYGWRL